MQTSSVNVITTTLISQLQSQTPSLHVMRPPPPLTLDPAPQTARTILQQQ